MASDIGSNGHSTLEELSTALHVQHKGTTVLSTACKMYYSKMCTKLKAVPQFLIG